MGEILAPAREQGLSTYADAYPHVAMRRGLPLATADETLRQTAVCIGVSVYGAGTETPDAIVPVRITSPA